MTAEAAVVTTDEAKNSDFLFILLAQNPTTNPSISTDANIELLT